MPNKPKVLYLLYDGLTDNLAQSQVLAYIRRLAEKGYEYHVISHEKPELFAKNEQTVKQSIEGLDITWHKLAYTSSPPMLSTMKDARNCWKKVQELVRKLGTV